MPLDEVALAAKRDKRYRELQAWFVVSQSFVRKAVLRRQEVEALACFWGYTLKPLTELHVSVPLDTTHETSHTPLVIPHMWRDMVESRSSILQGTLDLMVLTSLEQMGPLHGYGIARRIEPIGQQALVVNQGTITKGGRAQLKTKTESSERIAGVIGRVLQPHGGSQCPVSVIRDMIRGRGIPAGGVAPPSNMRNILGRCAWPSGRRAPRLMPRITETGH